MGLACILTSTRKENFEWSDVTWAFGTPREAQEAESTVILLAAGAYDAVSELSYESDKRRGSGAEPKILGRGLTYARLPSSVVYFVFLNLFHKL